MLPQASSKIALNIEWPRLRGWINNFSDKSINEAKISRNALIIGYKYVSDRISLLEERVSIAKRERGGAEAALVNQKLMEWRSRQLNFTAAWKEYERNLTGYVGYFQQIYTDISHGPLDALREILEIRVRDLKRIMTSQEQPSQQQYPARETGVMDAGLLERVAALAVDDAPDRETDHARQLAQVLALNDLADLTK